MRKHSVKFISLVLPALTTIAFTAHAQGPAPMQLEDWTILCNETCQATQVLVSEDGNLKYSASVSFTHDQKLLQMKYVFPLGIYLPANVALMVDGTEKDIPITTCVPSGCNALVILNSELEKTLINASLFKMRFFSTMSRENEITYSLNGFEKALEIVKQSSTKVN